MIRCHGKLAGITSAVIVQLSIYVLLFGDCSHFPGFLVPRPLLTNWEGILPGLPVTPLQSCSHIEKASFQVSNFPGFRVPTAPGKPAKAGPDLENLKKTGGFRAKTWKNILTLP